MNYLSKSWKKVLAGMLTIALTVVSLPLANMQIKAAEESPVKPAVGAYYENMFDDMTTERVLYNNTTTAEHFVTGTDERGNIEVSGETAAGTANASVGESIFYALNKTRYQAKATEWSRYDSGKLAIIGADWTELAASDTFVYAADFNITSGNLTFAFRTNQSVSGEHWIPDQNGFQIRDDNTWRLLLNTAWAGNGSLPVDYTDGKTHTLTILSEPEYVTIWIDDTLIVNRKEYKATVESDPTGSYVTSGTNKMYLKSTELVPAIALSARTNKADGSTVKFTVGNQFLHKVSNEAEDLSNEYGATDQNYFSNNNVYGVIEKTERGFITKVGDGQATASGVTLGEEFTATDCVIYEFDITPGKIVEGKETGFYVRYRNNTAATSGRYATLVERYLSSGQYTTLINYFADNISFVDCNKTNFSANTTYHYKIVADNEKVSVWVNGNVIKENAYYATTNAAVDTANMKPMFEIQFISGEWTVDNIVIRKTYGEGALENVTKATAENNLIMSYGPITSSFKGNADWEGKSDSVVNNMDFYTDLTKTNLANAGISNYYIDEMFWPFGAANENLQIEGTASFVMSTLVKVSNAKMDGQNNRVGAYIANYDGTMPWYWIETNKDATSGELTSKLVLMHNVSGTDTHIGDFDISGLYTMRKYNRLTTLVSPFGYEIYINGTKVVDIEMGDGINVNYSCLRFMTSGVEATFVDTSVYYNLMKEVYVEKLLEDARAYEATVKGIYSSKKAICDVSVDEIMDACASATDNTELQPYIGVIQGYTEEVLKSGTAVNNHVKQDVTQADNTFIAAVSTVASADLLGDNGVSTTGWIEGAPIVIYQTAPSLNNGDVWIMEADIVCEEQNANGNRRIGFKMSDQHGAYTMMINNQTVYSSGDQKVQDISVVWEKGEEWHVKYTVKWGEYIRMDITTSNATTCNVEVPWTELLTPTSFNPKLYFGNVKVNLQNIYVGYDLTDDITALNEVVTEGAAIDTTQYSDSTVTAFIEAYETAKTVNELAEAYTKSQIQTATTDLQEAKNNLKTAIQVLTVGSAEEGIVTIRLAQGENAPTGYIDDKYIISWNEQIANYIDLDMLNVKKQSRINAQDSNEIDVRYIASVDHLEYKSAGFVFSQTNELPDILTDAQISTTVVYQTLLADGEKMNVDAIYGNEGCNSEFMFAYEMTETPIGLTIYARAYVELSDGTIVYGDARAVTTTATGTSK